MKQAALLNDADEPLTSDALVYEFGRRTEEECRLLAAGIVPRVMQAEALNMLRFDDMLEANALKGTR